MMKIGLIGDKNEAVVAHQAIPKALQLAGREIECVPEVHWLNTGSIESGASLTEYHGLWCVPASPYESMQGALDGIRFAREHKMPFLGTCGGFQHGVIEFARNVLGWVEADHAETSPDTSLALMSPLTCALVEVEESVQFLDGSKLLAAYKQSQSNEGYHCSYGLNPEFLEELVNSALKVAAIDQDGNIRALELDSHPFFVMTLFQPERAALRGNTPAIVKAFLRACVGNISRQEK